MKTTKPYIRFDWELAQQEGNNVALVLAALIDHYEYFERNNQLVNNEFYNTKNMIGSKVNLKPDAIRKAENRLVELDYIRTRIGERNMKFYYINFAEINKPLNNIPAQSVDAIPALDVDIAAQSGYDTRSKRVVSPLKACSIAAQSGRNNTKESNQISRTDKQTKVSNNIDDKTISYYINLIKNKCIKSWKTLSKECPEIQRDHKLSTHFQKFNYIQCLAS